MSLQIQSANLSILNTHTRMPFKYGIAELTAVPHLFVELNVRIDQQDVRGIASDGLAPKWFTKNPDTSFEHDIQEMLEVIQAAADHAMSVGAAGNVFDLWHRIYEAQKQWGDSNNMPPLLWGFGVSLIERALIDAFCKAAQISFAEAVRTGRLGFRLDRIHPSLGGLEPNDYLPPEALRQVALRHTVGLADPLTDGDIPDHERLDDGLPQSLETCIDQYGLTHFKIKLCGDPDKDRHRLCQIAAILDQKIETYAHTLDGNEQYPSVEAFGDAWGALKSEPPLANFFSNLLFVEQPIHRTEALGESVTKALQQWTDRPPMIIDESDGTLTAAAQAIQGGYAGTSHKNCKGIFKGLANAALIHHQRQTYPDQTWVLSGEDLCNMGPVALLQDLATAATLGIGHVERNGHHYYRGIGAFSESIQQDTLAAHGDLYRTLDDGTVAVAAKDGSIQLGSVVDAPYGIGFELNTDTFTPLDQWQYGSLGLGPFGA